MPLRSVPDRRADRRPTAPRSRLVSGVAGAAIVLALLAAGLLSGCGGSTGGGSTGGARAGTVTSIAPGTRAQAPKMTGDLLGGGTYDLAAHRGQVVVVNFWASWCAPCRAEAADLEAVHQATTGSGVSFVGIDVKDEKDRALAFGSGRTTYPSVFDPASRLALGFKIPPDTIPATLVIDREGRVAVVIRRSVTRAELEPIVNQVVAESGAASHG